MAAERRTDMPLVPGSSPRLAKYQGIYLKGFGHMAHFA